MPTDIEKFLGARNLLLNTQNYKDAYENFRWPDVNKFNWALDYFDRIAKHNDNLSLICADESGMDRRVTFDEMRRKSNKVANFLRDLGLEKGDRVFVIMDTAVEVYELTLAIMKSGGIFIPGATTLPPNDIADRIGRGNIKFLVAHNDYVNKIMNVQPEILKKLKRMINVGDEKKEFLDKSADVPSWVHYKDAEKYDDNYTASFVTYSNDECYLFFTSGTTAKPKLVIHTHAYPIGHLSTMYWLNAKKGDIHYNISSPGWAKYAWSSVYSPWNAEATIFTFRYKKFDAKIVLKVIEKYKVTTLCAPLSVLKLFTIEDLSQYKLNLREIVSAGEPLVPDVVKKVENALGVEIREAYGQTESTCMIANFKGEPRKEASFGKCAPGYYMDVLDSFLDRSKPKEDGQLAVKVYPTKPLGLLTKYDDEAINSDRFRGSWYLTGDAAYYDENGYFYFVGRTDDVFKSLDYRISPFEVESEIAVHAAVLEVGVVPTEDERGRIVPKAFIVLKPGYEQTKETALDIFKFIRDNIAPYKRPRSIEFLKEFPKTISAKVRRKDLRAYDKELREKGGRGEFEYKELDFEKELNLGVRK